MVEEKGLGKILSGIFSIPLGTLQWMDHLSASFRVEEYNFYAKKHNLPMEESTNGYVMPSLFEFIKGNYDALRLN